MCKSRTTSQLKNNGGANVHIEATQANMHTSTTWLLKLNVESRLPSQSFCGLALQLVPALSTSGVAKVVRSSIVGYVFSHLLPWDFAF